MKILLYGLFIFFSSVSFGQVLIGSEPGQIDGRASAKYGTYFSVVPKNMQSFQNAILELENNVRGFIIQNPHLDTINLETVRSAGDLFLLENYCFSLMTKLDQMTTKTSDWNKKAMNLQLNRIYKEIRSMNEKKYETMIRFIDHKFPGPNGIQNKVYDKKSGMMAYAPNYRTDNKLSTQEKEQLYRKKISEFVQSGGSLNQIELLDKPFFNSLTGLARFEYVQLVDGRVLVTQSQAGHIVLASGQNVLAAGQMVIVKSQSNEVLSFVVSNASGSYKPDIINIELLIDQLAKEFKIPHYVFTTTKGEPLGLQTSKILLKGLSVEKSEANAILKEYQDKGSLILDSKDQVNFFKRKNPVLYCAGLFL